MSFELPVSYSVQANKITEYLDFSYCQGKKSIAKQSLLNLDQNDNGGKVSKASKGKINQYIDWIVATADWKTALDEKTNKFYTFKVNFITLTLPSPQVHPDQQIKRDCLGQLLSELKRKYPHIRYFWRAEKQANKNIHFHLLTNIYYHYKEIREDWNRIINKLGYVDKYKEKFTGITFKNYCSRYRNLSTLKEATLRNAWQNSKAEGWINPNTTDVHSVKKVKNLGAYISKYCSKDSTKKLTEKLPVMKLKRTNKVKYHVNIDEIVMIRKQLNVVFGKQYGCDIYTKKFSKVTSTANNDLFEIVEKVKDDSSVYRVKTDFSTTYYFSIYHHLQHSQTPTGTAFRNHVINYKTAHEQPIDNIISDLELCELFNGKEVKTDDSSEEMNEVHKRAEILLKEMEYLQCNLPF